MDPEMQAWLDRLFGETDRDGVDKLADFEEFCRADEATFRLLAEVCENPAKWLAPYSEACVAQAFWDLHTYVLSDLGRAHIGLDLLLRLFCSYEVLFREYFAVRCGPELGHLGEGGPLNGVCYLWWDMDCWYAIPRDVSMLRSILAIEHPACQESALHGLGLERRSGGAGSEVEGIIDEFLERHANLIPGLREYALLARRGMIQ